MSADKIRAEDFSPQLDDLSIKTLKFVGVEMVSRARSGHPGVVVSVATMLHTLATRHLVYDPNNPTWINRDRIIFSGGHASALIYTYLSILGLFTHEELMNFRQLHSHTSGHPEIDHRRGIEATTGPLGQGIANGVGLAIARAHLNARFSELDHYTYIFCGDGDLQEGVAHEAMALAGTLSLDKLIILYDSNKIQLDTPVASVVREDLATRCAAINWGYISAENTIDSIDDAITRAKLMRGPVMIEVHTIIGEGTTKAGTTAVHGSPLSDEELAQFRATLGYDYPPLYIAAEVCKYYRRLLSSRLITRPVTLSPAAHTFLTADNTSDFKITLDLPQNAATRVISQRVNDYVSAHIPQYIGGSADLSVSTKIYGADGTIAADQYHGRNILFGVREFAMAAIANGIAIHSVLRPFVSTFLVFADYLKPAMRLSAFMGLPVTYIFSHDSVFVGEDGPTHQPIEQLAMIRSIPNIQLVRPADGNETIGAYELAIRSTNRPTVIVTTRQDLPTLPTTSAQRLYSGFYYIHRTDSKWSIIATGSELALAYEIGKELGINVVSASYYNYGQAPLVDPDYAISIEVASTFGWARYARYNYGLDTYGLSGPGESVYHHFGFQHDRIRDWISDIISRK